MGIKHLLVSALCAGAIATPALAGEVTGGPNPKPTAVRDHANSICAFSGQEDGIYLSGFGPNGPIFSPTPPVETETCKLPATKPRPVSTTSPELPAIRASEEVGRINKRELRLRGGSRVRSSRNVMLARAFQP